MDDRRENLVLAAVVLSLAVHGVLMFFMRPQVMARITGSGASLRERTAMVAKQRPAYEDSVRLDVFDDIKPELEFPEARTDDAALRADETLKTLKDLTHKPDAVANEALKDVAVPKITVDPSEVLSRPVDEGDAPSLPQLSPAVHSAVSAAPSAVRPLALPRAVPSPLTATAVQVKPLEPIPVPVADEKVADKASKLPEPEKQAQTAAAYEPVKEVMAEISEKIVESEKAAVRDLLNVKGASELSDAVHTVATSASQGDWDYFRVRITARDDLKVVPKDVVILIDASGSISNDRLKSCRASAKKLLRSCMNSNDRFNIVAFRDDFRYAFKTWQECGRDSYERAERWMDNLAAHGRTDVFSTVASVLKLPRDPARPLIALVVTDAIANKGVVETSQILSRFSKLNDGLVSVYMYGVKEEANRELIDVLTKGNRGEGFVHEGSRRHAGRELEAFSERFRDPVMTDLRVVFSADSKAQAFPTLLKNLYRGRMVEIVGRVPKGTRDIAFSLKGLNGEKPYEGFFRYKISLMPFDAEVPVLWAAEKSVADRLR